VVAANKSISAKIRRNANILRYQKNFTKNVAAADYISCLNKKKQSKFVTSYMGPWWAGGWQQASHTLP